MAYLDKETLEKVKGYRFFTYLRKSSEDSEDRQIASLPRQTHEVEDQVIKKYGLKIIKAGSDKPYYEESRTAFKEGRPDFNDMIRRIDAGEADGVIVWHANRLARNYGDGGRFVQKVMDGKIKIVLTCYGFYENTPRDLEYLMTEFTRAARDSGDKSEAVKSGNRERFFEKKLWIGPAKPGYINYIDPITKEKTTPVDPDRFPLIQEAMRLILDGRSTPMEVWHWLNEEKGYRSKKTKRQGGKPMAKSGFYRMLSDPFYYGLMVRKQGETVATETGVHQPMIKKDEFDHLQIILGRKGRPHFTGHEFPYKSVLKCGECGGSITAEERWQIICPACKTKFHRGKKTDRCKGCALLIEEMKNPTILHYIHYHCTKKVHPDCSQGSITPGKLEQKIDETLKRFEIPEEFKDWAIKHLNELNDHEVQDRESVRQNFKGAYDDCVKKLDNLLKLKISPQNSNGDVISDEEYTNQRKSLLEEKQALLERINDTDARQNNWLELSERTFEFARYARYWFANGDVKTKTQILATLGSDITVKDRELAIDGQKAFFLIEKGLEEVRETAKALEPTKSMDELLQSGVFEPLRSCWLRG